MRKFAGAACMLVAVAMLAAAGWMIYRNHAEESMAGDSAEQALYALLAEMQAESLTAEPVPQQTTEPLRMEIELPEMPVMEIDGQEYIGYLEMPTIDVKLPVMSDWSYPKLRIAPCRYWGSAYDDSMIIMAHNYDRHFGRISTLEIGAPVQFVDATGNIYKYVVAKHEILEPGDVEGMTAEEWDLTLFTCTYGGASRVTVRLERVLAY